MSTKHQPQPGVVSYPEAARIVFNEASSIARHGLATERVLLTEATGRVLAQGIRADRDQPPFARSMRDGFACRAEDFGDGNWLTVIGQVRAGQSWTGSIGSGEAVEIMTGAPAPDGADCVVMVEHAESVDGRVRIVHREAPQAGANLAPAGSEAHAGELLLEPGAVLTPAAIGLAASCGAGEISVFAQPKIAILATGDELVEIGETPLPYQIRNSNSYALAALARAAGGQPIRFGPVQDEAAQLETAIRSALAADFVLISGGVSMGKYDLVEEVLLGLGAEFFFTGARIQPGKPVVFGRFPSPLSAQTPPKYFFGLPGNPVSAMVTFSLFAAPLIGALGGRPPASPTFVQAVLGAPVRAKPGLTRFVPARMESHLEEDGEAIQVLASPVHWKGSADLAGAARANCHLLVPPGRDLAAGQSVAVLL